MAETRIYLVCDRMDDGAGVRLVEASSGAMAIRHVTRGRYEARAAKSSELRDALKHGRKVEQAGDDKPEPQQQA